MKAYEYTAVVKDWRQNKYTHTLLAHTLSGALDMLEKHVDAQDNHQGAPVDIEEWMPTRILYIEEVKEVIIPQLGLQE